MLTRPTMVLAQDPVDLRTDATNPRVVYVDGIEVVIADLATGERQVIATAPARIVRAALDSTSSVNYTVTIDDAYQAFYQPAEGLPFQWFQMAAGLRRYNPEYEDEAYLKLGTTGFDEEGRACVSTYVETNYETTTVFTDRSDYHRYRFEPTSGFVQSDAGCPRLHTPQLHLAGCGGENPFTVDGDNIYLGDELVFAFEWEGDVDIDPSCVGDFFVAVSISYGTSASGAEAVVLRADGSQVVSFSSEVDGDRDGRFWQEAAATFTPDNRYLVWFHGSSTDFMDATGTVTTLPFYYGSLFAYFGEGEPVRTPDSTSPMTPPESIASSPHRDAQLFTVFDLVEGEGVRNALVAIAQSEGVPEGLFFQSDNRIFTFDGVICRASAEAAACATSYAQLDAAASSQVLELVTLINEANYHILDYFQRDGETWAQLPAIKCFWGDSSIDGGIICDLDSSELQPILVGTVEVRSRRPTLGLTEEDLVVHQAACLASGSHRCESDRFEREMGGVSRRLWNFEIMAAEVTRIAYAGCIMSGACTAIDESTCQIRNADYGDDWDVNRTLPELSLRPNAPRTCVTRTEAEAFCDYAGGRLPTELEWEAAAAGLDENIYPWGNEFIPAAANYLDNGGIGLALNDDHPEGETSTGLQQMAGNAYEWVSTPACPYEHLRGDRCDIETDQGVVRGGSFASDATSLRTTYRKFMDPEARVDTNGFRCFFE